MNPRNISNLVAEYFNETDPGAIIPAERDVASLIIQEIIQICKKSNVIEQTYENDDVILDLRDEHDDGDVEDDIYYKHFENISDKNDSDTENKNEENDEDFEPAPVEKKPRRDIPAEDIERALLYYREPDKGNRTFTSMNKAFRWIKTPKDIENILLAYERKTRPSKFVLLKKIDSGIIEILVKKFLQGLPIHDADIRTWALKINNELETPLPNFKASPNFVLNFKNRLHHIPELGGYFRIKNRRITNVISREQFHNADEIRQSGIDFVANIKKIIKENDLSNDIIYNCDQSSFNKELHSKYTLAPEGIKKVTLSAESKSATTHSYTIMPILTMSGTFLPVLYVLIQEPSGHFPTTKKISLPKNIYASANKSSMMTKQELSNFLKFVFFKHSENGALLLVDHWSPWKDEELIAENTPDEKSVNLQIMPPTSMIQPLDVGIFKVWKQMDRRICDYGLLHDYSKLHDRENILKRQSFIHFQFSAPRFQEFNKKAWYNAGYIDEKPSECITPLKYCFEFSVNKCNFPKCQNTSFARCGYCELYFCYDHCIEKLHFCE